MSQFGVPVGYVTILKKIIQLKAIHKLCRLKNYCIIDIYLYSRVSKKKSTQTFLSLEAIS